MSTTRTLEVTLPPKVYDALQEAAERTRKTANEIAIEAIDAYLKRLGDIDPLLGLFADEPDLIERALDDVMKTRETGHLRLA